MSYLCSSKALTFERNPSNETLQNKGSCQGCAPTICTRSEEEGCCACHENAFRLSVISVVSNAFLQNRGLGNQRCVPSMHIMISVHGMRLYSDLLAVCLLEALMFGRNPLNEIPQNKEECFCEWHEVIIFLLSAVSVVPGIDVREKGG